MLQLKESELRRVLQDFYVLTKIRIVVLDTQMEVVLSYPEDARTFCKILRTDAAINQKCLTSDRIACKKCARSQNAITYQCHAGLTESIVPIQDAAGVIGYLMFGQVLQGASPDQKKGRLRQNYGSRFPEIQEAIDAIPVKTPEEIAAAATILRALTDYVYTSRFVVPQKSEFIRHLDQYIEEHLEQSITVEKLCQEFRISRNRSYDLANGYLGMGIAEYIRSKRIDYAKELLISSDMTITDIAEASGFADYTHFSRVFRKMAGVSARTYRIEHRAK